MLLWVPSDRHVVAKSTPKKGETDMMNLMTRLWKEEEGQDLIEYALLIALIALAATARHELVGKVNQQRVHEPGNQPDQRHHLSGWL